MRDKANPVHRAHIRANRNRLIRKDSAIYSNDFDLIVCRIIQVVYHLKRPPNTWLDLTEFNGRLTASAYVSTRIHAHWSKAFGLVGSAKLKDHRNRGRRILPHVHAQFPFLSTKESSACGVHAQQRLPTMLKLRRILNFNHFAMRAYRIF